MNRGMTLLLAVATVGGGCAPVQTYPYHEVGASPDRGDSIAAAHRDVFESWTIDRVKALRQLFDERADESDPRVIEIATELEKAAVDWKTFLVKSDDAFKFPMMAYANHTWFQIRQAADVERNLRVITGNMEEASNLLPDGRVPNSAFFTDTDIRSYTPERLRQEFDEIAPVGAIKITKEKKDGTSEGFFGEDERGKDYIFIFDPPSNPEMQTSAEHIGSTLVRMMGWRVPKTIVCTVSGTGNPQYDGRRACATLAVKKYSGGWTYRNYRNRREVRSLTTVAAWLNNVDQSEHNTGISQPAEGVYAYYIWDYGCSMGSFTFRPKWPRLGWQYIFDPIRRHTATLLGPPWETAWQIHSPAVGYFTDNFDPDRWVPFYPNLGLEDATYSDKRWAAERIAKVTDEQIRAIVESAKYTYPSDSEYVIATLVARRNHIALRYLASTTPDYPFVPARDLTSP